MAARACSPYSVPPVPARRASARRYGRKWLGDWPGGVYFCDLSEARTLDAIFFVVALALDVQLGKADAGVQLGHAIATRGRCLLILDNFEQIVAQAEASIGRWLDRAPDAGVPHNEPRAIAPRRRGRPRA